ncbi:MAG TPA: hypothetical protein VK976_03410 [Verrucomicrobiae bacterium]|jgi:hypothetical protein|nr:hypothetical protein [Verrucomicrobiae bacterium]
MRTLLAIVGLGAVILLLFIGAKIAGSSLDVWAAVKAAPGQFLNYVSTSMSHQMLWTIVVIVGVVGVIALIQKVPPAKI